MSAPTPAPGDDKPREGYYPDPSIPGYVRYWNGAAWVPGTSRPAPSGGEALAPPAAARPAHVPAPATSPEYTTPRGRTDVPAAEETGPHFFDEDPQPHHPAPAEPHHPAPAEPHHPAPAESRHPVPAEAQHPAPAESQHGNRPEPAASWGADRSRQSGFGGDQDRRVSWGAPKGADPRAAGPADPVSRPDGASARADGTTTIPPAPDSGSASRPSAATGPVVFRRPTGPVPSAGPDGAAGASATSRTDEASSGGAESRIGPGTGAAPGTAPSGAGHLTATPGTADPVPAEGDAAFRAPSPRTERQGGGTGSADAPGVSPASGPSAASAATGRPTAAPGPTAASAASAPPAASTAPAGGGFGAGTAAHSAAVPGAAQSAAPGAAAQPSAGQAAPAPAGQAAPASAVPQQPGESAPVASGTGGGQPSWAQQVHQLAGEPAEAGQRVAPWKPPVDDPFQAAARRQAAARPAGFGRRLVARLLDTVVIAGVTAAAAVPLGTRAVDHVDEKIDAAKLSGEKVTVWLLDGTTASCLGAVLAVLLVFGVLYEVLPTARWGRTLGKKLCGIEVRDIEGHEPPGFGRALVRWLVLSVPCLLVVGLAGVVWGLFDKPWSQCWHDKAAHTFVAGPAR
ncbi:RDD family protein [Streptomyces sp. SAS_267]|uniref:RDD family protein n=1 Tax=Streptomyces sp. SAS_267 TaxID=3412750 RepID=UPI00403C64EC